MPDIINQMVAIHRSARQQGCHIKRWKCSHLMHEALKDELRAYDIAGFEPVKIDYVHSILGAALILVD